MKDALITAIQSTIINTSEIQIQQGVSGDYTYSSITIAPEEVTDFGEFIRIVFDNGAICADTLSVDFDDVENEYICSGDTSVTYLKFSA